MLIGFKNAVTRLKGGEVIAVPTETVYGLAATIKDSMALKKIFSIKERPAGKPLIVLINSLLQLPDLVKSLPDGFERLKPFWPGPLTIVFPANTQTVPPEVHAGTNTVAIRLTSHKLLRRLIAETGPLAAPSANKNGFREPIVAEDVEKSLGADFPVLDGGKCPYGVPSTLISLDNTGWRLLRAGALEPEKIVAVLGKAFS